MEKSRIESACGDQSSSINKLHLVTTSQPLKTSTANTKKEFNFGFDETIRDQNQAINESKLQQYQEVIKKVRLGMDDVKEHLKK